MLLGNGTGKVISGLTINRTASNQGLFGWLGIGGRNENLGMANVSIFGSAGVGGVAAMAEGRVANCYVSGSLSGGANVGGVAGWSQDTMESYYFAGSVADGHPVGGVASVVNGVVRNCCASALFAFLARLSGMRNCSQMGQVDLFTR